MNSAGGKLLEEKDRTLGAIGHDLRTPLASLRIRAESVRAGRRPRADGRHHRGDDGDARGYPDAGKGGAVARAVRAKPTCRARRVPCRADYRELGHKRSTFQCRWRRTCLAFQPNLLRRAVRNLVDNAVKYAGSAEIKVSSESGWRSALPYLVEDRGQGRKNSIMPATADFIVASRRATARQGGAGLGLSIAQAVADAHGGNADARRARQWRAYRDDRPCRAQLIRAGSGGQARTRLSSTQAAPCVGGCRKEFPDERQEHNRRIDDSLQSGARPNPAYGEDSRELGEGGQTPHSTRIRASSTNPPRPDNSAGAATRRTSAGRAGHGHHPPG